MMEYLGCGLSFAIVSEDEVAVVAIVVLELVEGTGFILREQLVHYCQVFQGEVVVVSFVVLRSL